MPIYHLYEKESVQIRNTFICFYSENAVASENFNYLIQNSLHLTTHTIRQKNVLNNNGSTMLFNYEAKN